MPESITTTSIAVFLVTLVMLSFVVVIIFIIQIQQKKRFTLQQQNLEILSESEQRYRRLVKFSPFPMAVLIKDVIAYVNDAGGKMLDVPNPEDLINHSVTNFVTPEYYESAREKLGALIEQGNDMAVIDDRLVRTDGVVIDIELAAIPVIYDGKEAIQVLIKDITERKREEAELVAAKERAEQSDRLKDAFIANISHEIRTPLNVILGYTTLLATMFEDRIREDERTFFESIQRGGQRLMRTVEHILNISSIQVGTFEIRPEVLDVAARAEKLVQDLQSIAQEKDLKLEFVHDATTALIYADRYCIDQALTNLIENAVKFTNKGGVTVRVSRESPRICIEVMDTGIGMSADYLPKVFNVFSQEFTGYTRPFEGLGLGLALTKRYVEMNKGSVTVKSRKGQGTTFTMRFLAEEPVQHAPEEAPRERLQQHIVSSLMPRSERKRLLVVEDDEQTQAYMNVLFKDSYEVIAAVSGTEVWETLGLTAVDTILMDLSLRGKEDGLQIIRKIRQMETHSEVPIIVITAHAYPEDKLKCFEAGCDLYFSKPFQIEEVKQAVKVLADGGRGSSLPPAV
jgi:PAS domain S-box-containing protein